MKGTSPDYQKLLTSGVVSKPYASQIASGKRTPGLSKALEIYAATGLKFGQIAEATAKEIAALQRVFGGSA